MIFKIVLKSIMKILVKYRLSQTFYKCFTCKKHVSKLKTKKWNMKMSYTLSRYAFWKRFNIWKMVKSIEYSGNHKKASIIHFQITVTSHLQTRFPIKSTENKYKIKTHF